MHSFPARPPRLKEVFPSFDPPLYFVTFCTWHRARILASEAVHAAFIDPYVTTDRLGGRSGSLRLRMGVLLPTGSTKPAGVTLTLSLGDALHCGAARLPGRRPPDHSSSWLG